MDKKIVLVLYGLIQLLTTCLSQPTATTCIDCSRQPGTCRKISGLFTVTVLTKGTYNPVVEIPAPACSINITEFRDSNNYIAVKTKNNQGIINSYWALVQPGQYYGAGARFSYDRHSGSCRGTCIFSEGPTTEPLVIQVLYNSKNPGIAYEFVLPNDVAFTPFDGTQTKQESEGDVQESTTSPPISSPSSSSSRESSSRSHRRGSHHRRHRHHKKPAAVGVENGRKVEFEGEYYTGSQYSRSEGRPDITSALESKPDDRRSGQGQDTGLDYTGVKYGSHTLGGRGLSYTSARDPRTQSRGQGSVSSPRVLQRYRTRSGPHIVRKVSSPKYVAATGQRGYSQPAQRVNNAYSQPGQRTSSGYSQSRQRAGSSYSHSGQRASSGYPQSGQRGAYPRQPRYQSFSAKTSYLDRNKAIETFDGSNHLKTFGRRVTLNSGSIVGAGSLYRWKISGLTECSKSCGGGTQRTNIVCVSVSDRTQVVVTSENCANAIKPRAQVVECNSSPCDAAWEADKWSECSVTCGSGTQTRKVECRQRFSPSLTLRVSADQCGLKDKPAVAQQCEQELCSHWKTGPWGKCNKECGGGERQRTVKCVDKFESQIPSNYCTQAQPRQLEPCNTQSCDSQWWVSDWSKECSESCGSGFQYRRVLCVSKDGDVMSESQCETQPILELRKVCQTDAGCYGTWFAGAWGTCSAQCGEGIRRRPVVCLQRSDYQTMEIVEDEECDAALKPQTEESCVNSECGDSWFTSPWSECSVTCGEGYKRREVRCLENSGRESASCVRSLQPSATESCSREACGLFQRTNEHRRTSATRRTQDQRRTNERNVRTEFGGAGYIGSYDDDDDDDEWNDDGKRSKYTYSNGKDNYEEEEVNGGTPDRDMFDDDDGEVISEGISPDLASYETGVNSEATVGCKDKYWRCLMVIQARLCNYDYYRDICCNSCSKH